MMISPAVSPSRARLLCDLRTRNITDGVTHRTETISSAAQSDEIRAVCVPTVQNRNSGSIEESMSAENASNGGISLFFTIRRLL